MMDEEGVISESEIKLLEDNIKCIMHLTVDIAILASCFGLLMLTIAQSATKPEVAYKLSFALWWIGIWSWIFYMYLLHKKYSWRQMLDECIIKYLKNFRVFFQRGSNVPLIQAMLFGLMLIFSIFFLIN
jgi:hypothetical protein